MIIEVDQLNKKHACDYADLACVDAASNQKMTPINVVFFYISDNIRVVYTHLSREQILAKVVTKDIYVVIKKSTDAKEMINLFREVSGCPVEFHVDANRVSGSLGWLTSEFLPDEVQMFDYMKRWGLAQIELNLKRGIQASLIAKGRMRYGRLILVPFNSHRISLVMGTPQSLAALGKKRKKKPVQDRLYMGWTARSRHAVLSVVDYKHLGVQRYLGISDFRKMMSLRRSVGFVFLNRKVYNESFVTRHCRLFVERWSIVEKNCSYSPLAIAYAYETLLWVVAFLKRRRIKVKHPTVDADIIKVHRFYEKHVVQVGSLGDGEVDAVVGSSKLSRKFTRVQGKTAEVVASDTRMKSEVEYELSAIISRITKNVEDRRSKRQAAITAAMEVSTAAIKAQEEHVAL